MKQPPLIICLAIVAIVGARIGLALGADAAPATLPPQVVLPYPAATYVRVMPGCVWGSGSKTLTITRKTGQPFNFVNLDSVSHRMSQAAGVHIALPWWSMKQYEAIGFIWRSPTTGVLTTCSGALRLTVKVG